MIKKLFLFLFILISPALFSQDYTERDKAALYKSVQDCKQVMNETTTLYSNEDSRYHFYKYGQLAVKNNLLINIEKYDDFFYELYKNLFKFTGYYESIKTEQTIPPPWNINQINAILHFIREYQTFFSRLKTIYLDKQDGEELLFNAFPKTNALINANQEKFDLLNNICKDTT